MLKEEKPVVHLQRIAADLSKEEEQKELFARLGANTNKALIITEGVIAYLKNEQAASLSRDLFAVPSFQYWIQDFSQGKFRKNKQTKDLKKSLGNTPLQFDVDNPLAFFQAHGWKIEEVIFVLDEADRIGRSLPLLFPWNLLVKLFPGKMREQVNKTYGYIMFGKP